MKRKVKRILLLILIIFLSISIGSIGSFLIARNTSQASSSFDKLKTFIKNNWYSSIYYDSKDDEDLLIDQFIGALKTDDKTMLDPYTYIYKPESSSESYLSGFVTKNIYNYPVITKIFTDSDANNKLQVGDIILAEGNEINGKVNYNYIKDNDITYSNISNNITKDEGISVYYKVARFVDNKPTFLDVSILSKKLKENTVSKINTDIPDTLFVNISGFKTGSTCNELEELLKENDKKNLVIDIKDNGGGDLKAVSDICSLFIEKDKLLTTLIYKDNSKSEYKSSNKDKYSFDNIFIYMNGNTASASEILVSVLSYYLDNVTLLGEKTYGKGIAQNNQSILNGKYMLKYTCAKWYRPDGSWIGMTGSLFEDGYQLGFEPTSGYKISKTADLLSYSKYLTSLKYSKDSFITVDSVSNNAKYFLSMYNEIYNKDYRVDGYFDDNCINAINDYQVSKGLNPLGYVDETTYLYFVNDYNNSYNNYLSLYDNLVKEKLNG